MAKTTRTTVALRERVLSDKKTKSLYLDFYPAIVSPETGKLTRRLFLDLHITIRPKTDEERATNDSKKAEAETRRIEIESAIQKGEYGKPKSKLYLIEYFECYISDRDITASIYNGCLNYLNEFTKVNDKAIKLTDIDDEFINGFKSYLIKAKNRKNGKTLTKNSAANYFVVFRAILHQAFKDRLLTEDIRARHENIKKAETNREFLSLDELKSMAETPCSNDVLKRAFIFSALTGLRYSDVESLQWDEISTDNGTTYIKKRIVKSNRFERLPLSVDALQYMGNRESNDSTVFDGLKYSYHMNNDLRYWAASAGITRHITFHSARHTFATLQLTLGTDIYTVSKILGHRELTTTQIYAKIIDAKKVEAVNRIKL